MGRRKPPTKPLSEVRFDFVDALENVCTQAIMLLQAVDAALEVGTLSGDILKARAQALRTALIGDDQ